jgi:hypothetical protein
LYSEGVSDPLVRGISLTVDAVRVDLQQDRDAVVSTPGDPGALAAVTETAPSLCIQVTAAQDSSQAGQAANWTVTIWAAGGSVPGTAVRLTASPAGSAAPLFSFGCGSSDGIAAGNLGTVDPDSAPRQLQAQLTAPSGATPVTLTATASAAGLSLPPHASAPVAVLSPAATVTGHPGAARRPAQPLSHVTGPHEVPRGFRTVRPLGWTIWKGEIFAPTEEELLT